MCRAFHQPGNSGSLLIVAIHTHVQHSQGRCATKCTIQSDCTRKSLHSVHVRMSRNTHLTNPHSPPTIFGDHRNAVCCGVLRCVAVCCGVLQCVSVSCSVLQGVCEYVIKVHEPDEYPFTPYDCCDNTQTLKLMP